jgi:cysteinyl-tRNA synthetase
MQLHDTLTRELRPLTAEDGSRLRMYVCGPTVYGPAHSELRTFCCSTAAPHGRGRGLDPFYVRNITDVDAKRSRARARPGCRWPIHRAGRTSSRRLRALNMLRRMSNRPPPHTSAQVALVEKLLASGHAYVGGDA